MSKKLNFGPMDEKCFISRSELLQWINNLLQVSVTKIEQLGSGNIYCQLFDVIYPGKIPLNKLKWKAKHEYEFNHNFKFLQKGFDSVSVAKAIPIEKLVKTKYQDNLEFCQWMKRFFDINCKDKGRSYDPKKKRNYEEPDLSFSVGGVLPQYTMIYGNFKDMDREIVKNESSDEEGDQSKKIKPLEKGEDHQVEDNDKENINSANVPQVTKHFKLNNGEKKTIPSSNLGSSNNNNTNNNNSNGNNGMNNITSCPYFMNNNINEMQSVSKVAVFNFGNSSLFRQLEEKEMSISSDLKRENEKLLKISKLITSSHVSQNSEKKQLLDVLLAIKSIIQ